MQHWYPLETCENCTLRPLLKPAESESCLFLVCDTGTVHFPSHIVVHPVYVARDGEQRWPPVTEKVRDTEPTQQRLPSGLSESIFN